MLLILKSLISGTVVDVVVEISVVEVVTVTVGNTVDVVVVAIDVELVVVTNGIGSSLIVCILLFVNCNNFVQSSQP